MKVLPGTDASPRAQPAPRAASAPLSRTAVVDAIARVVARRGSEALHWSTLARDVGSPSVSNAWRWFEDMPSLVVECYTRSAQGLEESLLRGETAAGNALEKLAAFLVAALETRRERGAFLPLRSGEDVPPAQRKRLRERDMMIRTRLKRLLIKGQHDGSVAQRHVDAACAMILSCLQASGLSSAESEQRMWDGELVELLLAALAEPHVTDAPAQHHVAVVPGSCACGTVRYEVDGPFDVVSHCRCSMCRNRSASATLVAAPLGRFRWMAGADAVTIYRSGDDARAFCSKCGSLTPLLAPDTDIVLCPAANLEAALGIRPESHIFASPQAPRAVLPRPRYPAR